MAHAAALPTPALPVPTAPEIPALPVIPLKAVVPWGLFAVLLAVVSMYFVGVEQGAASLFSGAGIHELVHDARHLLGAPCH